MKIRSTSYLLSKQRVKQAKDRQAAQTKHTRAEMDFEMATDVEDIKYRAIDKRLAQWIGLEFVKQYPGHGWQVEADSRNGVANVFNRYLSGRYGWRMKLKEINVATFSKDVMRIGGEMLRRFGINNDKMVEQEIMDVARDHAGNIKVDLS